MVRWAGCCSVTGGPGVIGGSAVGRAGRYSIAGRCSRVL